MKRAPDLYFFNPTCEYAVGNGSPNWQPNRLLQKMEADLSVLPLFFASSDDVVLVDQIPSTGHLNRLHQLGIPIPRFILKKEALLTPYIQSQKWNSLKPWGWSPAVHKLLMPFKESCSEDFKLSPVFNWETEYRDLYTKKFSLEILTRILKEFPNENFIESDDTARVCFQQEDIERLISEWGKLMVKALWSSSGRGLQPITKTPVHPKVWEKLLGMIREQGYAMVEPLLNKKLDIAFQFCVEKGKISFAGISNFMTDSKGQYIGNHLNGLPDNYEPKLVKFAQFIPQIIVDPLIKILESSQIARLYEGYFGVDALIYENKSGILKVNPCLEINLRYNMGILSVQLERLLVAGTKGIYRTWYQPGHSYFDFKQEMEQKYPLRIAGNRLSSGFLSLTDPQADSMFGAYILL